jgi:hypothetical protein
MFLHPCKQDNICNRFGYEQAGTEPEKYIKGGENITHYKLHHQSHICIINNFK